MDLQMAKKARTGSELHAEAAGGSQHKRECKGPLCSVPCSSHGPFSRASPSVPCFPSVPCVRVFMFLSVPLCTMFSATCSFFPPWGVS